jgi:hypothetical protein
VSGATVSAGSGITVGTVTFVSSTRLTASFAIAGPTAMGPRDVTVVNPNDVGGTLVRGFTVNTPVVVTLVYNGRNQRDRVGGGDTAITGDGSNDAEITLTLSAGGGRTVTAVQLSNGIGGVWDTTAPNASWVLGVATASTAPLLNNPTNMSVNTFVADGGSLTLFASDYNGGQGFQPGRTLTVTTSFSDGTSVIATVVTQ